MMVRPVTNFLTDTPLFKSMIGFSPKRSIPALSPVTLRKWEKRHRKIRQRPVGTKGSVCLFADEFTNYNDSDIGIKAVMLLESLGYNVTIPHHKESGRTFLSKGLLRTAKNIAIKNIKLFKDIISDECPLVGIEPSALLAFRDEYPEMAGRQFEEAARSIARNAFLFEEFICMEADKGNIIPEQFTDNTLKILLHGHCQQKAIASTGPTRRMLSMPANYHVDEIDDGCCGMAGAFGYEKEHYDLSMKIGEMVLFPAVRSASEETVIVASGTSCRHHIADGTGRKAFHPVEVMYDALIK
jgi:Fe-S oxidoreductase